MKQSITDTANNQVYNLKHVDITYGFDQGLYGDHYFEVRLDYMNDEGSSGTWVTVAKFMFNSENPHLPERVSTSEMTKQEAYDLANLCAQQLALEMKTDVHTRGNVLHLLKKKKASL
jgi:hypothetical protein